MPADRIRRLVPTLALLGALGIAGAAEPSAHYQGTDRRRIVVELGDRLTDLPQDWRGKLQVWHYNAQPPRGLDGMPLAEIPEREAIAISDAQLSDGKLIVTLAERGSLSTRVLVDGVALVPAPAAAAGLRLTTSLGVVRVIEDAQFNARPGASGIVNLGDRFTRVYPTGEIGDAQPLMSQARNVINMDQVAQTWPEVDGSGGTTNPNNKLSVVVLDTGIDPGHAFFGGRVVYTQNFTDQGGSSNVTDAVGHGTHVSGTIGSQDATHRGIAHGVNLIHLKVLGTRGGTSEWISNALDWCVDNATRYNIVAVNMSLGGGFSTTPLREYCTPYFAALRNRGILPVVSTGNSFYEVGSALGTAYPAADPGAFGVGATYDAARAPTEWGGAERQFVRTIDVDRICYFANRHPSMLRVMAPGSLIISAKPGGGTASMQGTSMAAPMVAGLVALAQDHALRNRGQRLSVGEISSLLRSTGTTVKDGDDEDDAVRNSGLSWPRIDAYKMLRTISDGGGGGGGGTTANSTINIESDPDVCIEGLTTGSFIITASPANNADISVDLTISGDANPGADYTTITVPVVIPAGSTAVEVAVTPLVDAVVEPPENVIATIRSGNYIIGSRRSATVTIRDADTTAPNQGQMMMILQGQAQSDVVSVSINGQLAVLGENQRWAIELPVSKGSATLTAVSADGSIEQRPLLFNVIGQGGTPEIPSGRN